MYEEEFISDEQKNDLFEIFKTFDIDKDNYLTLNELTSAINNIEQDISIDEIKEMMKEVDINNDGKIDFDEFVTLMTKRKINEDAQEEILNAFKIFDKDNSGFISSIELKHILTSIGDKLTEDEVDELLNIADIDENGMINYLDFINLMSIN